MERRLAAILAADVVGYSRLMAADEAGTLAALKAHRQEFIEPKLAEHHGRIVKLMGDGVLVEFASVVEAVQCAIEIQQGLPERNAAVCRTTAIVFRIGVNLGDMIIEDDDILRRRGQRRRPPRELPRRAASVSRRRSATRSRTSCPTASSPSVEQQVKNIPRPVHVFRVFPDGPVSPAATGRGRAKSTRWLWAVAAAGVVLLSPPAVLGSVHSNNAHRQHRIRPRRRRTPPTSTAAGAP